VVRDLVDRGAAKRLGEFLGARRQALGITRKEACRAVGASATWYAWLEQGRATRPTEDLIHRVERLLQLAPFERRLVRHLVAGIATDEDEPETAVTPRLRTLLDHFEPCPAYVVNARRDLLAYNRASCDVYGDLDALAPDDRNLLWVVFTHPTVRKRLVNWEGAARRAVATFRLARLASPRPASFDPLVERLQEESREFRTWWKRLEVHPSDVTEDQVDHPDVGLLTLTNTPLVAGDDPNLIVLLVTAAPGTETLARLHELRSLRARKV